MARHRISSLDRRGIADFDELIHKKIRRILRSCLIALYFDPTTLIEIAVNRLGFRSLMVSSNLSVLHDMAEVRVTGLRQP